MSIKMQLRRLLHLLPAVERCHKTRPNLCGIQVANNWVGLTDGHRCARIEIPPHLWVRPADAPARYQLPLAGFRSATKTDAAALAYLDHIYAVPETIPDLNVPALSADAVTGSSRQWVTRLGIVSHLEHMIHARAVAHRDALTKWRAQYAEVVAKNRAAMLAADAEWRSVTKPPKGDKAAAAAYKAARDVWQGKKYKLAVARRELKEKHGREEPKLSYSIELRPMAGWLDIVNGTEVLLARAAQLYAGASPDPKARSVFVDARYLRDAVHGMTGADSRVVLTLSTDDPMEVMKVEPLNAATRDYALIMPMRG